MEIQTFPRPRRRRIAAFTIVEVMMAAGILGIGLTSLVAVTSTVNKNLRRGVKASFASQLIQERMEQFRRAAWTEVTSVYPPDEDDPEDVDYDVDTDGDAYVDEDYPTEFPYAPEDLAGLSPGMVDLMTIPTASAAQLPNVKEYVKVECYNSTATAQTAFDWDGSTITIAPFTTGGRPILVKRENGTVTEVTHNAMAVYSTTVRLTFTVKWQELGQPERIKETVTLFTVEGDK